MLGTLFPPPRVSDPDMHHARAWRTCRDAYRDRQPAVSFEVVGGKNVPAFPAHAQPVHSIFFILGNISFYSRYISLMRPNCLKMELTFKLWNAISKLLLFHVFSMFFEVIDFVQVPLVHKNWINWHFGCSILGDMMCSVERYMSLSHWHTGQCIINLRRVWRMYREQWSRFWNVP